MGLGGGLRHLGRQGERAEFQFAKGGGPSKNKRIKYKIFFWGSQPRRWPLFAPFATVCATSCCPDKFPLSYEQNKSTFVFFFLKKTHKLLRLLSLLKGRKKREISEGGSPWTRLAERKIENKTTFLMEHVLSRWSSYHPQN